MLATQGLSEWQGVLAICRDPAFRFRPLIVHWDRDNVRTEVNAQMGVVRGCYLYMMEYRLGVNSGGVSCARCFRSAYSVAPRS